MVVSCLVSRSGPQGWPGAGVGHVQECPLVDLTASESDALVHLGVKLR
jgi:hypothetical protein